MVVVHWVLQSRVVSLKEVVSMVVSEETTTMLKAGWSVPAVHQLERQIVIVRLERNSRCGDVVYLVEERLVGQLGFP